MLQNRYNLLPGLFSKNASNILQPVQPDTANLKQLVVESPVENRNRRFSSVEESPFFKILFEPKKQQPLIFKESQQNLPNAPEQSFRPRRASQHIEQEPPVDFTPVARRRSILKQRTDGEAESTKKKVNFRDIGKESERSNQNHQKVFDFLNTWKLE